MESSIQALILLQKEYDLLACIEEKLDTHITKISDMDVGTEIIDQLVSARKVTLDRMSEVHHKANQMTRKLRLHKPSKI